MASTLPEPYAHPLPPQAPRIRAPISGRLGALWLRLSGWRMVDPFPDFPKAVIIVAPHSSNMDGLHGLAIKQVLGLDANFLAKRQLFWWPLGSILRHFGIIPIDRGNGGSALIDSAVARFADNERFWLGVAPEGTRKPVARWKTGFWRIAKAAGVPIIPVYFHYPEKRVGVGSPLWPGDDMEADIATVRAFYEPWRGAGGKSAVTVTMPSDAPPG